MNKEILDQIEERFHKALEAKTSWGRNDVKALYSKVQLDVLKEHLDKKPETKS